MIHTYSLIHDDLPCMDNASLRRGQPTCHRKFGEAMAVLAGDALLTHAFVVLGAQQARGAVPPDVAGKVTALIAEAAGVVGMVGGQALDILHAGTRAQMQPEQLFEIHQRKTGALIRAAAEAGAVVGGATSGGQSALRLYGERIGLAFQIADDLLDVRGDVAALGKDVAGDAPQEKITFPAVFGIERSQQLAQQSLEQAIAAVQEFGNEAEFLRALARFVVSRDS
jgi:geranylgeranyl diphosphate synthase type II